MKERLPAMGYKVAVIGATGNVGREMLNILAEREFPADEVFAIASRRSMGVEVSFGDQRLKCRDLEQFDFRGVDFALMSAGSGVSKDWAPRIGAQGFEVDEAFDEIVEWIDIERVEFVGREVARHRLEPVLHRRCGEGHQ